MDRLDGSSGLSSASSAYEICLQVLLLPWPLSSVYDGQDAHAGSAAALWLPELVGWWGGVVGPPCRHHA